jgi:spoIIIJ-associated protein
MLSVEGTGRTIEKAIESALTELKAKREDVDIKIIEEGGLFKKAKVLVTISEDSNEKYEKKVQKVSEESVEKLDVKAMFADLKTETKQEETKKEIKKEVKTEEKKTEIKTETKIEEKKLASNKCNKDCLTGVEFIKGLLKELKISGNVLVEETPNEINVSIEGENSGDLIGYRGECLNAIQYIASILQNENTEARKRLVLDIEKYRARREESLKALALRMESKVLKINKSIKLEPMSANERRIIHTTLQESGKVTTISKGLEPNRFIVILPKRDAQNFEEVDDNNAI